MASRVYLDHDGEPLLTAEAAARRLGMNVETVRRWIRKGVIAYIEVGPYRRRRLRQCEVDRQRRASGAA